MHKILIIEDDSFIRSNITDLLETEGFFVITAENGLSGLEQAKAVIPDLIICDIMMPGLDGYGVLESLREQLNSRIIPFIFLTAKADKTDIFKGMRLGADDYITKPFDPDDLLSAIKLRLKKKEAVDKKLNDLRENLTLALPHELRTPLTAILGYSQIIEQEAGILSASEIAEFAYHIYGSGMRLKRMIKNYLLFSELEMHSRLMVERPASKNYTEFHPGEIIISVSELIKKENGKSTNLILCSEPGQLRISQEDFKTLVFELLDNAHKFSDRNSPVKVKSEIKNHRYVISFINQGRGFTREQIDNIGAYMQFDRKRYEQQGHGLGLIISKKIVELYGGQFSVSSTPGKLTEVNISLPVAN